MGGKLNIYNLGVSGVVVDKSPIHEQDGELLLAQNAQVDSVGVLGGIRKRDGFGRLNPLVLAGAVTGMLPLPLPDEGAMVPKFYLAQESGPNWKTSANGTTWVDATVPTRAVASASTGMENGLTTLWAIPWRGFRNRLYYPGDDYTRGVTNPTIHCWDGITDEVIARITPSQYDATNTPSKAVTSIVPYSPTELLVAVVDSNVAHGASRVFILDTSTHQLTPIAPQSNFTDGWILGGLVVWRGAIWIGGYHGDGGATVYLWWARPSDLKWNQMLNLTAGTAHGYVTSMVVFKGNLYVSYAADLNVHGDIYQCTTQGLWTEVYISDGSATGNYVGPMIVTADGNTLLAFQNSVGGGAAPQNRIIQTTNGASWTLAYDVSTALSNSYGRSGMPFLDTTGAIYWPLASGSGGGQGGLLKRTTTGVWSIVLSNITTMRGPLGIIRA